MFLAHMEVFEVDSPKNSFTLVERTALQQRIKLYSLQTKAKDERVGGYGMDMHVQQSGVGVGGGG